MTLLRGSRLPWSLLGYALLAACNVVPPALYLMGPRRALEATLCRTWSLGALGFFDLWENPAVMARVSATLPGREARAVAALSLFTASLVTLFLLGHRLFGKRFLILASLLSLPMVTIMPGPSPDQEPGLWLAVVSQTFWWAALLLAAGEALRVAPDFRGCLWILAVAGSLAALFGYPVGVSLAIGVAATATLLVRRRALRRRGGEGG